MTFGPFFSSMLINDFIKCLLLWNNIAREYNDFINLLIDFCLLLSSISKNDCIKYWWISNNTVGEFNKLISYIIYLLIYSIDTLFILLLYINQWLHQTLWLMWNNIDCEYIKIIIYLNKIMYFLISISAYHCIKYWWLWNDIACR